MKEGFDREIDSLLRRRARGTAELRPWGDGARDGSLGTHLDADELSAFAEGALPSAARVAAASHLADCERCRGVVVGLARVAGAGAEEKIQAVAATAPKESVRTPAWRALFASLFSPRAMRLAVPVLALSLVGVVSYVALRSKGRGGSQVAMNASQRPGVPQGQPTASVAPGEIAEDADTSGVLNQNTDASAKQEETAPAPAQSEPRKEHREADAPVEAPDGGAGTQPSGAAPAPPPVASAPAAAAEGPAEIAKAAPKPVSTEETEVTRNESRDRAESREKSARGAEPADDYAANDAALARNRAAQSQSRMGQVQMPDGGAARNSEKRADNNAAGGYNVGGGAAAPKDSERESAGTRTETRRGRASKQGEKKADEDETSRGGDSDARSAAGHRFRREGNRWVDVNYRSSMSSTGVRRGTDAFRALVADVPEVGRVAASIGGEVIVVVGGRAYHIR